MSLCLDDCASGCLFAISPGNPWDREFDYELWFHSVDRNNDSLISFGELRDELRRYSSDGELVLY